jgi:hypothetical protein
MGSADREDESRALMAWPALNSESYSWVSRPGFGPRVTDNTGLVRYEAAVPPRIADLIPRLESEVLTISDEATRELSRFDAEQGMEIAGFAPVLLRSEATSSSQIENLTASARAIF